MNSRLRAVARVGVRTVNSPVAKARMNTIVATTPRPVRLELGGLTPRPGWIVTNVNALARLYLDATRRWPLEDDAAAYIYADNVIEHITLEAGRAMLSEAARCLQPGGVIRLVTPDIRAHVEMYLSGADPLDSAAGRYYRGMGLTVEHPIDLVRIPIGSFGHHAGYVYDFETLERELLRVGFGAVTRCELGQSEHPELAGLDMRGHEGGAQMAVEATV